jgi:HEAT repeat protein
MAMNTCRLVWGIVFCGLVLGFTSARSADEAMISADEARLKSAGLGSDGAALLDFLKKRTVSKDDLVRLAALVRNLGDDHFSVREKASADLAAAGRAAIPLLREAVKEGDLEISRRAEKCLRAIEEHANSGLSVAVVRLVAARRPEGAVKVLLNFAPFADDATVEEELIATLLAVGIRDGKTDARLLAALKDELPVRRALAANVLGRSADAEQRALVRLLLKDKDVKVRFHAVQGLLKGKEKDAITSLISLLADAPADMVWEVKAS